MPRPGASRNVAYGVVQNGITGTFPDGGHQSQRRDLKQAARGAAPIRRGAAVLCGCSGRGRPPSGTAGCGCIAYRAQAGRPVRCGCGDRPARTMDEAGAVDRGVVEEPSELRHDQGPSDDARDAGRDNHEVCPRTAPDLQPVPPVSRFRPHAMISICFAAVPGMRTAPCRRLAATHSGEATGKGAAPG
jgi:hypothetical protein